MVSCKKKEGIHNTSNGDAMAARWAYSRNSLAEMMDVAASEKALKVMCCLTRVQVGPRMLTN